ncbi:MAG: NAD(P)H-dependent glycerol-3-phosphate dehydrogenase [Rickettsiaceae bacterium]|nr:NAD(P)H-dependent glycerol-3-phosphate dehydrogenase [Rickettsiaceae bacterium]
MQNKKFAVIGAGSWGTALACMFARATGHSLLYSKDSNIAQEINLSHSNQRYLSNTELPNNMIASANFADIFDYEIIVIATPANSFCSIISELKPYLRQNTILLVASKGMCDQPIQLFSEKIESTISNDFGFIYGPNFAKEVAEGKETAITIAARDHQIQNKLVHYITSPEITVESTSDIITVQIASMAKNIFAIQSGILQAKGAGENIRAALISQALKEISILAVYLGGEYKSLSLSCVVGDLVLTCYSHTSRNTKFGYEFHHNNYSQEFLVNYPLLVEGINSARLLGKFTAQHQLNLPIIQATAELVS